MKGDSLFARHFRKKRGEGGRHSRLREQNVQSHGVENWSVEFLELEVSTVGEVNVLGERQ